MESELQELLRICNLYFHDPLLEDFEISQYPEDYRYLMDLAEEISSLAGLLFITKDNDFNRDHIAHFQDHGYIIGISLKQPDGKRLGVIQKNQHKLMF